MAAKRRKYNGFGTIAGVKRVLWTILQRVQERIEDETASDESRRSWANTGIQAALAYAKLHESSEFERRLEAVEARQTQEG